MKITTNQIKKAVASYFRVSPVLLDSPSRRHEIVFPRQIAYYLCLKYKTDSSLMIGYNIGKRDHATVLHSLRSITNMIETNYKEKGLFITEILSEIEKTITPINIVRFRKIYNPFGKSIIHALII